MFLNVKGKIAWITCEPYSRRTIDFLEIIVELFLRSLISLYGKLLLFTL